MISYRYSSCSCCSSCSSKKCNSWSVGSNLIGPVKFGTKFNVLQVNRLTESDYRYEVTGLLSRRQPWRHFTQKNWEKCCHLVSIHKASANSWSIVHSFLLDQELIPYRYRPRPKSCRWSSCTGAMLFKSLKFHRFKLHRGDTWQDCSSEMCNENLVGFLIWMTSACRSRARHNVRYSLANASDVVGSLCAL